MDKTLAEEMLRQFAAQSPLDGYQFRAVLGNGKSAAVFQAAAPDGQLRAIKIYDPDIAERFGFEVQEERQRRELELANHYCPTLVQIYRGGAVTVAGRASTFLEMEFVEGRDLSSMIAPYAFADVAIRKALRELCAAANFLHERGLCHRDIKPDNIRCRPDGRLVLLDLGVLRPVEGSALTETPAGRPFVGTLRYAPPELLHDRVAENEDGWRAVDIYQVGAVLYELIQGVRLFSHVPDNPYADLVVAVDHQAPVLVRGDVGADLLRLTRNTLEKDAGARLRAAPWSMVTGVANAPSFDASQPSDHAAAFEARMHAASSQYASVADAARRATVAREHAAKVAEDALRVTTSELDIKPHAWHGGEVRTEVTQDQNHTIVSVAVYGDLEHGFMGNTVLAIALQRTQDPVGHLVARGLGLHTPHFFPEIQKSTLAVLSGFDVDAHWETLYAERFDADEFRRLIRAWFHATVVTHLDAIQPLVAAELEAQRARLEATVGRVGGGVTVHMSSSTASERWFTSKASGLLKRVPATLRRHR